MNPRLGFFAAIAIVSSACLGPMKIEQPLTPTFADLATIQTIEVVSDSGVLMKGTFADAPAGGGGKIERTATLSNPSGTGPSGKAAIEIERANGLTEEELEIKLDNLPFPASCRVMADGKELTSFSTMEKGKLNLHLSRRVAPTK